MASIGVIGLGNWGTALAHHLARQGHNVTAWTRDRAVVEAISKTNKHPSIFSDVTLDKKVTAVTDIQLASEKPIVVYALPSASLRDVVPTMTFSPDAVFISAVKGFERESALTPLQFVSAHFASVKVAVISGPSFATDMIHRKSCGLVAACRDAIVAKNVAELFASSEIRVYTSVDPIGVELGGALKNVIALAAGVCDGLSLGESARAGLITRGLAEMMRFAEAFGADRYTLSGLSGLGDLIMTATSMQSRNYLVGYRLGKGEALADILSSLGSVAESVKTAPIVVSQAKKRGIEMPISDRMLALINGEITVAEGLQQLLQRPLRSE